MLQRNERNIPKTFIVSGITWLIFKPYASMVARHIVRQAYAALYEPDWENLSLVKRILKNGEYYTIILPGMEHAGNRAYEWLDSEYGPIILYMVLGSLQATTQFVLSPCTKRLCIRRAETKNENHHTDDPDFQPGMYDDDDDDETPRRSWFCCRQ